MDTTKQIEDIKSKVTSNEDKGIIAEWERQLKQIELDEKYLTLPQTEKIVEVLQGYLKDVESKISYTDSLTLNDLTEFNQLFIQRKIYRQLLYLFKVNDDFKSQRSQLEQEINEAQTKL